MMLAMAAAAAFADPASGVRLERPRWATVSRTLDGRSLMTGGWRLMWDGAAAGPGDGVVRLTIDARPARGPGVVSEMLQVGYGGGTRAVATCFSQGLGDGTRLPDRVIGGRRWAAWRHGDAGMSQQIDAIDLRTVYAGRCYAAARISYAVRAADAPRGLPAQTYAAAALDRALASLRLTRPR